MDKYRKLEFPSAQEALPGRQQSMSIPQLHEVLKTPISAPLPIGMAKVLFGMGCFWGAEKLLWQAEGVYTTAVGYGAGHTPNPTYEEVCSGRTGHNELVLVVYDPKQLKFATLLKLFWESHDPTQGMRQGNDLGTQYRSGIYVYDAEQEAEAIKSQAIYDQALLSQSPSPSPSLSPTTTEICRDVTFYYAEAYHQQYLFKQSHGYCPNHSYSTTGLPPFPLEALQSSSE